MGKKLRETANLCVEIMNSERTTSKRETWSSGANSRLPFDVNMMLNLSNAPGGGYSEQSIKSQTERRSPLYCSNYKKLWNVDSLFLGRSIDAWSWGDCWWVNEDVALCKFVVSLANILFIVHFRVSSETRSVLTVFAQLHFETFNGVQM